MGKPAEAANPPPVSRSRGRADRTSNAARIRRRWLWRAFFLGVALGLFLAGLQQARDDVNTIRALFGV